MAAGKRRERGDRSRSNKILFTTTQYSVFYILPRKEDTPVDVKSVAGR